MSSIVSECFFDSLDDEVQEFMITLGFDEYTNIKKFYETDNIVTLYYKKHHKHKYAFISNLYCNTCFLISNFFIKNKELYILHKYKNSYACTCIDINIFYDHLIKCKNRK